MAVSDSDLVVAEGIRHLFTADPSLSSASGNVLTSVYHGVVTLRGTVPSDLDRDEMVMRIKKLPGVTEVKDELSVNLR